MKRISCFLAAVVIFCAFSMESKGLYILADILPEDSQFCFYTYSAGQDFDGERVSVGNGEILVCSLGQASARAKGLEDISGESVRFLGGTNEANEVLIRLNAVTVKTESLGGIVVIYARTAYIKGTLPVDGKRVNVQIAINNGFVTVGTPLILGSY